MALSLCVREVVSLRVVQREAQLALVRAEVVPHEVRVLGQVDGFERELPQPLPAIDRGLRLRHDATGAGLGALPVLEVDASLQSQRQPHRVAILHAVVAARQQASGR